MNNQSTAQQFLLTLPWPNGFARDYKAPHAHRPAPKRQRSNLPKQFRLFKGWRP